MLKKNNRFTLMLLFSASLYASETAFKRDDAFTTDLVKLRQLVATYPQEMLNEDFFGRSLWSLEHAIRFQNPEPSDIWHYPTALARVEILHEHHKVNHGIQHKYLHRELLACWVNTELISWLLSKEYNPNYIWERQTDGTQGFSLLSILLKSPRTKITRRTALDELIHKIADRDIKGRQIPSEYDASAVALLKEKGALFTDKESAMQIVDSIISGRFHKRPSEIETAKQIKELISDIGELPKH